MTDSSTDSERTGPQIDERKFDVRRIDADPGHRRGRTAHAGAVDGDDRPRVSPDRLSPDRSRDAVGKRWEAYRNERSHTTVSHPGDSKSAVPGEQKRPTETRHVPQLEELYFYQSVVGGELTRPYLQTLPAGRLADRLVIGWLRYLTRRSGYRGTLDALDQYAAVGWISDDVRTDLEEYLRAFHDAATASPGLTVRDHEVSLTHLARLVLLS